MKESKSMFKGPGFVGVALCAACCALPIFGVMLGVGALSVLSKYFEWAGVAALVFALVFLAIYYFKKRQTPSQQYERRLFRSQIIALPSRTVKTIFL